MTDGATTTPSWIRSDDAIAASRSLPPWRRALPVTMPPREMTAASDAPRAEYGDRRSDGVLHRQAHADGGGDRRFDQRRLTGAGLDRRLAKGPALDARSRATARS